MGDRELKDRLALLADPDNDVIIPVFAALLEYHTSILPELAKLQDSADPVVRRRAHQLQSILTMRERRYNLMRRIDEGMTFPDFMLELHLQWYDFDMSQEISRVWSDFEDEFRKSGATGLTQAAGYMKSIGFCAVPDTAGDVNVYCMGPALSALKMAGSLCCGMVRYLLGSSEVAVFRKGRVFGLTDGRVELYPQDGWKLTSVEQDKSAVSEFDEQKIMKFSLMMLFTHSVCGDEFRYVYTLGQALTGCRDDSFLSCLPYPYRHMPDEVYEQQDLNRMDD